MKTQTISVCIVHSNIEQSWVEGTLAKWYKKLSELSSLYLMTNSKIGNHGV